MTILYLGNKLIKHGVNPTSVETLGERFKEFASVYQFSDKKNTFLRMLDMWKAVYTYRKKVDWVIIDTYSTTAFHFAWTSALLSKIVGLNYILILRGGNLSNRFEKSFFVAKSMVKNASRIIAPSGYLQQLTQNKFDINTVLIPNFIDIHYYPFKQRHAITDDVKLLWVRAFDKIYNPTLAIQIVEVARKKGINVSLTMVGPDKDGSLLSCQDLAKHLEIEKFINFTGRLSKTDWISIAQEHDIFINTTNIDNTPVSVMEAMATGLPVITTNVGGIPFLFENGKEGIMVEPNQADLFVKAIQALIAEPLMYHDLSLAARTKALEWDWKIVKSQWKSILT